VTTAERIERGVPWVVRALWVGVLVAGGAAIDGAVDGRSGAVAATARWGGFAGWVIGVAAMAIPAVTSLTATRAIVPLAVPAIVIAWVAGADDLAATVALAVAGLATVVACSGELGRAFVQASAYGEEDRHLLRPPPAYLLASVITWLLWAAATLTGPLLLAARQWVPGGVVTALALALGWFGAPRWHRLARRWFVIVPVGVVVHDQVALAETLMLRRQEVRALRLAPAGTAAADLTGPAAGHAIEIETAETVTAILAASRDHPTGHVIHLTACLVAPTRPGRALLAAGRRRLPVG
jgi:hypothetical protein